MRFTNKFEQLTKEVQEFIKNKVDTSITFGNPCYKQADEYICYVDIDGEEDVIPLEEMETHILCGIADDIVNMNMGLGGNN